MAFATIQQAFAYYTECALATAEGLDTRKSSSQSQRRRAWSIAEGMVAEYRAAHRAMDPSEQRDALRRLPRLIKRMEDQP